MPKAPIVAAAVVLSLAVAGAARPAPTFSKQDVTLPMDDGATIAATLYRPSGDPPPRPTMPWHTS